jgi:hypothetical protein
MGLVPNEICIMHTNYNKNISIEITYPNNKMIPKSNLIFIIFWHVTYAWKYRGLY